MAKPSIVIPRGPALGLTEDNASLLWFPGAVSADAPGAGASSALRTARREITALHPTYLRLLIDWAALAPTPGAPPNLQARVDGCARGVGPCGAYAGVRAELAAIASQQRAGNGFGVVLTIFGVPGWAARGPLGCELPGAGAFARALAPAGMTGYRMLIRSLLAMAASQGVSLEWWSPWNEPNDPRFISPQRSSCAVASRALSPASYGELARAMASELRAAGGTHHLLLGELNDLEVSSPHTLSVAEFVRALPADVLCLGNVWSLHAYATYGAGARPEALGGLEAALDARGGCAHGAGIWVTEAGAGGPHPGRARVREPAQEREGCLALERQLRDWYADPRVQAVFQYTFREDPAFPVGLASADLTHLYPAYRLWLAWSRALGGGQPPPSAAVCA